MRTFLQDVRYGLRILAANPGFTAAAVISLAVGIGANTAMFSLADAILLRPLPVERPGEVVRILSTTRGDNAGYASYPDFLDFRNQTRTLSGVVAWSQILLGFRANSSNAAQVKLGAVVTTDFFDVLGVRPALGRGFRKDEDQQPVAVLSYALWKSQLSGDSSVIGRQIRLSNLDFTVIGVLPETFPGVQLFVHEELYVPLGMWPRVSSSDASPIERRDHRNLFVYGRLRPGRSVRDVQAEFATIGRNLEQAYPDTNHGRSVAAVTEIDARKRNESDLPPLVALLLTIAGLVLIIACANVANLLLSRARARSREIAIRLAIGAGRARLLQQFLTESLLLSIFGGAAGLLMAMVCMQFLSSIRMPTDFPIRLVVPVDTRVLVFCTIASLASGLIFGLAPALQMLKTDLTGTLKAGDLAVSGRKRRLHARNLLVVGQVTVSTVLLVASGLLVKDFVQTLDFHPGFRTDHVLLMALDPAVARYKEPQTRDFYKQLLAHVHALPGVRSVALGQNVPLGISHSMTTVNIEGFETQRDQQGFHLFYNTIDESYLATMQIPLVDGRNFDSRDSASSPPVAIINQTMAQRYWPNRSALGGRMEIEGKTLQVVGIARDMKYNDVSEEPTPFFFLPFSQRYTPAMTLHIETVGDPAGFTAPVMAEIRRLDPELPVQEVMTLHHFFQEGALFANRLIAQLVTTIGLLGLILASLGLYGVIAYSVSRRTREIGIRMAVGASRADVLRLVLGQGAALVLIGVALGSGLGVLLSPLLRSQLVGVNPRDPGVFLAVPLLLSTVSLLACYVPARRAARTHPLSALRQE
ncbi:MAG TPA: ABC transporter permease [Bryobacteraceae bacterium]|nr:ABC transporter permease [Bryobacteraceae bacterium]